MDVLLLFEYPTLCGGEQSMLCLVPSIQAAGWRVRAAAPPAGPLAEALQAHGVEVLPLALHDQAGVRRPLETCREELAALLAHARPALLHANSLSMARLSGPVAAEQKVPSLGHIRDIVGLSRRAVADVNRHTKLLTVSHAAREFHVAQGIDADRLHVLYNAVDVSRFYPRPPSGYLHRELGVPIGAHLVAAIGQMGPRKGLDQVLLAMQRVVLHHADVQLLIVGERLSTKTESVEFERSLIDMATAAPLTGHVHFLGWRNDVAALLPELTLLVHAARQEPLGRVLLEAAASGCPVVATQVGGTGEIFEPGDDGACLVPPGDPQALAEEMISLIKSVSGGRQATRPAPNRPAREQKFGIERASSLLVDHYQRTVDKGRFIRL